VTRRLRPLARLVDLFVFAPIGFLLEAPRLVPELAEAGRRSLLGCRRAGQPRAGQPQAGPATPGFGGPALRPLTGVAGGAPPDAELVDPAEEIVITVEREDEVEDDPLPIPGYDQLAASQVIAHLTGLSTGELKHIEGYETAHRHRRTILAKIAQLRA